MKDEKKKNLGWRYMYRDASFIFFGGWVMMICLGVLLPKFGQETFSYWESVATVALLSFIPSLVRLARRQLIN